MSTSKERISKENLYLCQGFHVDSDRCENHEYYEQYLKFSAYQDMMSGLGVTYLYVDTDDITGQKTLMGYITLRFSSFIKDMGEHKKFGYPALEISELAVNSFYAGQGIGTDMVIDAINTANIINEQISIKYIILCADPNAEEFYTRKPLGFKRMSDYGEDIPREHTNLECVPLYLKLR